MVSALTAIPVLSDRDLATITRLVYAKSGISLHSGKRALVTARLQKLLKRSGFSTFKAYIRHLQNERSGQELTAMLDAIATNHTAFFREPQHFDFLAKVVLPPLRARDETTPILGWSAACSTGEEPYTIAMTAFEQFGSTPGRPLRLLASDLSTKALARATEGIYKADRVAGLPRYLILKYFEKGDDLPAAADVFRNPDRCGRQGVVSRLEQRLGPGGYLFTSHSESLNGLKHGLTWVAPAVYRRERS